MHISRKIIHQSLACTPVFLVQFLLGIGWGWIAPTLQKLQSSDSDLRITVEEAAWLGSINEVGRIVGPFISPLFLDNVGRKNTIVVVAILNVLSWAVVIFSSNVHILLAARILFGISNGVSDVSASIYISEICSPELRGLGGSGMMLTAMLGLICGSFVTTYISFRNTAFINTLLAICTVGVQYFGVESPYFLTMKGKYERARKNLDWLREDQHNEDELSRIRKNVEEEAEKRKSFRILLTDSTNLKGIFAAVGFYLLFSSVGFHTVTPYSSLIFSPSKTFTTNEYTILFGFSLFVGVIISLFVVERFDRRPLIICSFSIILCCNFGTAVLVYLRSHNYDTEIAFYPWLLFASISLYGIAGLVVAPIMYVVAGELLPLSVRAIGGSMAVTASSVGSFITAAIFWPITTNFGMEANFLAYTVMSILVIIFVHSAVPETRGKSLHNMHAKSTREEYS